MKIRVGIIGGAGYTGGELLRILINHPEVEIVFVEIVNLFSAIIIISWRYEHPVLS